MRLIPKTDDSAFPYEKAIEKILYAESEISFEPVDFDLLIEKGANIGWTDDMLEEHRMMQKRGKCFNFRDNQRYGLWGTIWEDNILFYFESKEHQLKCLQKIQSLAQVLEVRVQEN